jgi:hypothetical protein
LQALEAVFVSSRNLEAVVEVQEAKASKDRVVSVFAPYLLLAVLYVI